MPEANDLTVGIMSLVAQAEREATSRRTKGALAVAKARGVRLGNPNGAEALRHAGKGAVALRRAVTANADLFAEGLESVLADIRAQGHTTLRAMAAELNRRGMRTRRGGKWQVSNVRNLIKRSAASSVVVSSVRARGLQSQEFLRVRAVWPDERPPRSASQIMSRDRWPARFDRPEPRRS